jgi:PIN domain nuclease of toxin-antitoxin system
MGSLNLSGATKAYLLDTHTFLWAAMLADKLGDLARTLIADPDNRIYLSAISSYEISQKYRLGKLDYYAPIMDNLNDVCLRLQLLDLPVTRAHAYQAGLMDWPHRDPFDRILAAQALAQNLTLLTHDPIFKNLPHLETVW